MKSIPLRSRAATGTAAFTLLELLLVIVIIAILASLLLPVLAKAQRRSKSTQCISHLKQIGIAFHTFAHDHESQFPMQVSTNFGGSREFLRIAANIGDGFYSAFRHLRALSNELGTPKILVCPADQRVPAERFKELTNGNVSYFVGGNADYLKPDSILAGDRNLTVVGGPGIPLRLGPNDSVVWTADLHQNSGNLLFADGRVEQVTSAGVRAAFRDVVTVLPPGLSSGSSSSTRSASGNSPGSSASSRPGAGSSASGSASSGGALQRLEAFFYGNPAGRRAPAAANQVPASASNVVDAVAFSPPTSTPTNPLPALSTDVPPPAKVDPPETVAWPDEVAKSVTAMGYRLTYWLLLALALVVVAMEIQRRRRKARRRISQDESN